MSLNYIFVMVWYRHDFISFLAVIFIPRMIPDKLYQLFCSYFDWIHHFHGITHFHCTSYCLFWERHLFCYILIGDYVDLFFLQNLIFGICNLSFQISLPFCIIYFIGDQNLGIQHKCLLAIHFVIGLEWPWLQLVFLVILAKLWHYFWSHRWVPMQQIFSISQQFWLLFD